MPRNDDLDYHESGVCDFCGRTKCDPSLMLQGLWKDKTRYYCDIECLDGFKAAAVIVNEDEVFEGPPGTAKRLLEQHMKESEKNDT